MKFKSLVAAYIVGFFFPLEIYFWAKGVLKAEEEEREARGNE